MATRRNRISRVANGGSGSSRSRRYTQKSRYSEGFIRRMNEPLNFVSIAAVRNKLTREEIDEIERRRAVAMKSVTERMTEQMMKR